MYEDKIERVQNWHVRHPNKAEMAEWLSLLSTWRLDYYDPLHVTEHIKYLELRFGSLEELDLKLSIAGY